MAIILLFAGAVIGLIMIIVGMSLGSAYTYRYSIYGYKGPEPTDRQVRRAIKLTILGGILMFAFIITIIVMAKGVK